MRLAKFLIKNHEFFLLKFPYLHDVLNVGLFLSLELGWSGIDSVVVDGQQNLKTIEFLGDFDLRT
jgi:hypothetical protein